MLPLRYALILINLLLSTVSFPLWAGEKETALKAGFLFNFARYSEWQAPATPLGSFKICSPDLNFLNSAHNTLAKQQVHDLPIEMTHINLRPIENYSCNLVFIPAGYQSEWESTDKRSLSHSMLVGESAHFIAQGGHIRLFILSGKIRFEVAPQSLKQAHIVMSSKVLRLSRVVKEEK